MIEYTITPMVYDAEKAHLTVEITPVDTSLEIRDQSLVVVLSAETLAEILAETEVAPQKAIVRREVLRFNEFLQNSWNNEIAFRQAVPPPALLELLGVQGTTPVTQAEIDLLIAEG